MGRLFILEQLLGHYFSSRNKKVDTSFFPHEHLNKMGVKTNTKET